MAFGAGAPPRGSTSRRRISASVGLHPSTPMKREIALRTLLEPSVDAELSKERIGLARRRLIERDVQGASGARNSENIPDRAAQRNGWHDPIQETLAERAKRRIPKPRRGRCLPSFREPRRPAETALAAVIRDAYGQGVSFRASAGQAEGRAAAGSPASG